MKTPQVSSSEPLPPLQFYGGLPGTLAPFFLYLVGVAWLAFSGAPDERGFWPILLAAITLGLLLATDRTTYCETLIKGMSQPIIAIMIMAWLLAGVLGSLMNASGFVEALIWLARQIGLSGGGFVGAAFLISAVVSTSTGTSFGTIFLCGPLLYPAGGALDANPAALIGAIIGGATFGDNISPISDTTIASALSQLADIGGVVRSRLKYALPAAGVALLLYVAFGTADGASAATEAGLSEGNPRGFPMLIVPVLVITLLLRKRHLIEGLLFGILAGSLIGLTFGLLKPSEFLYIDAENFIARGIILEGLERGIGISILTLLLMGLVTSLQATGVLNRIVGFAQKRSKTPRAAEWWIFGAVSSSVLLTMHSVVAILTVGEFSRETGGRFGISSYRRANILDVTTSSFPFILPWFIPTILAAGTTVSGEGFGMPRVSPLDTGLHNFHSWMLLIVIVLAIWTGYGRTFLPDKVNESSEETN
jgi:Na+/H+ antiporter NhaC